MEKGGVGYLLKELRLTARAGVDYNSFLKLLVASMQKQDPTQPNDPAQTMSQLASFSNVEQSIKLNDKLDKLLAIGDKYEAMIAADKAADSRFR